MVIYSRMDDVADEMCVLQAEIDVLAIKFGQMPFKVSGNHARCEDLVQDDWCKQHAAISSELRQISAFIEHTRDMLLESINALMEGDRVATEAVRRLMNSEGSQ